jgi:hypothetical protein
MTLGLQKDGLFITLARSWRVLPQVPERKLLSRISLPVEAKLLHINTLNATRIFLNGF